MSLSIVPRCGLSAYEPEAPCASGTGKAVASMQFLSTTPGASTPTPPSASGNLVQQLGKAVATTIIRFSPQEIATVA